MTPSSVSLFIMILLPGTGGASWTLMELSPLQQPLSASQKSHDLTNWGETRDIRCPREEIPPQLGVGPNLQFPPIQKIKTKWMFIRQDDLTCICIQFIVRGSVSPHGSTINGLPRDDIGPRLVRLEWWCRGPHGQKEGRAIGQGGGVWAICGGGVGRIWVWDNSSQEAKRPNPFDDHCELKPHTSFIEPHKQITLVKSFIVSDKMHFGFNLKSS